ncbi:type I glutamate--ammonia ligase [candidate division KSB1 bacterium]|mgnify:CR=1 FL=1|nr:type I glutamate--ammonia ligase [bacterium]RKY78332.1 MAG: type I glutamate--ammonia ligase [candidate division KSB1 bacterium]RKY87201.1 MAG: type I glutamate--ammonia ligase [candidate division KSB1 bacterium]HDI52272.1 type I glutamate--ammonia ligase [Bacteroidota bacterium]
MSHIERVLALAKESEAKILDLKFMDFPGLWQHFSLPISSLEESLFEEGAGFDGSSLRGWQTIHESDMLVIPDPSTAFIDPFMQPTTLSMICDVVNPLTKEKYSRCPRNIAQKAESYLKATGIADVAYFGPEAEFFIFDDVRFDQDTHSAFFVIDSTEGRWNFGKEENPNLGYKLNYKSGYFPVPPHDSLQNIRSEMMMTMLQCGLRVECHHHEVATGGQAEIDLHYDKLVIIADALMLYKYIVKNVARRHNKTATFMPKPIMNDNGSGMHVHQSLWKDNKPLFAGTEYAGLSELALYYIGGLLKHAPALTAFTNPTINSYRRLVPGFEAPVNLAYSQQNRSAAIRIPMYFADPKAKRVEFRCPDPSCNPYLAFSAMLMAGIDGIVNKIHPGEPMDKNIYDLPPEVLKELPTTPGSLEEALNALEQDYDFLLKGDVFTEDVIETWIRYKREQEVVPMKLHPTPIEFTLYFDV